MLSNDIQKLNGRPKTLTRFTTKSAGKALPFFKILKKDKNSTGKKNVKPPSSNSKKHYPPPLTLTKPEPRETLYLCLAIIEEATSVVLVKDDNKIQKSVCFVS